MKEQTASATWARMYPRLLRDIERLRGHGCEITVPPNFETPPHKRGLPLSPELGYSTGMGEAPAGTDGGPPLLNDRTEEPCH